MLVSKEQRIETMKQIFISEKFPISMGFTDHDVNLNAPRLFTDAFIAQYLHFLSGIAIYNYTLSVSICPRADIREFFKNGLAYFSDRQNEIMTMLVQKGIYARSPYVPYPEQIDFVKETSFLDGLIGKKRPLHMIQITHLYLNMLRNELGEQILTAFAQVTSSQENKQLYLEGKRLTSDLIGTFSSLLKEGDLIPTNFVGVGVTNSTVSPFSEKLMLNLISSLNFFAIAVYGMALSDSLRTDLFALYTKVLASTGKYGLDGLQLMIKNGYLEEPPKSPDRLEMANV